MGLLTVHVDIRVLQPRGLRALQSLVFGVSTSALGSLHSVTHGRCTARTLGVAVHAFWGSQGAGGHRG